MNDSESKVSLYAMASAGLEAANVLRSVLSGLYRAARLAGKERTDESAPAGKSVSDESGSPLVRRLFAGSRYAIDPGEMSAYRHPELDTPYSIAFEFVARGESKSEGVTVSCQEGFVAFAYRSFEKTVRLFDEKVASMRCVRFLTKEEASDPEKRGETAACGPEESPQQPSGDAAEALNRFLFSFSPAGCGNGRTGERKRSGPCDGAGGRPAKTSEPARSPASAYEPPSASALKRLLIGGSRYRIPVKRLKVMQGRKDTKSQRYVYELRFFQRDYTKTPADTQSYESAVLRIPMKAFDPNSAIARFDKAVSELKFNEFQERK